MAYFLRRIWPFGALLCAFFGFNYLANQALKPLHKTVLPENVHTVFLGDSHIQLALDPDQVPGSVNLGGSGEPFMTTYFKAMKVLEWNPHVDVLVLGVGPHNIGAYNDRKLGEGWASREMFRRYHGIVPWDSIRNVSIDRSTRFMVWVQEEILPNFHLWQDAWVTLLGSTPAHPFEGGYSRQEKGPPLTAEALEITLDRHFPDRNSEVPSDLQQKFLEKLVEEGVRRGLRVVAVSTPVHEGYRQATPRALTTRHAEILENLDRREGVGVLDLTSALLDPAMFRDFDHVNAAGAAIVSGALEEYLNAEGAQGNPR